MDYMGTISNYTPYDNITKEEKHIKEKEAILTVLETLDEDNDSSFNIKEDDPSIGWGDLH